MTVFFQPQSLYLRAIEGLSVFSENVRPLELKGNGSLSLSLSSCEMYSCCPRSVLTLCRRASVFSQTFAGWSGAIKHSSPHKQPCFQDLR